MRTIILAALITALPTAAAQAQYQQDWIQTVGGFWGVAVGTDAAGNVYATGASPNLPANGYAHDIYTIKYAPDGTQLWLRQYNNDDDPTNQEDDPSWLTVDGSGNVLVTGTTHTNAQGVEAVTLKYDPQGNLLWERLQGSSGTNSDYGAFVDTDPLDNVYMTGRSFGSAWDFRTSKYDPDGNLQWSRQRSFDFADEPRALDVDGSGRVVVMGETSGLRISTVVYDTNGNEIWADVLGGTSAPFYTPGHAIFGAKGEVFVAGRKDGQMLLVKYSSTGQILFERTYEPGIANRVRIDSNGDAILTGESLTGGNTITIKVDAVGNPVWTATFENALGVDLAVLADDGVIVASNRNWALWTLVRYDSQGNEEWNLEADPGGFFDAPTMMAVDANENVVLTGSDPIATARFVPPASTGVAQIASGPASILLRSIRPNPFAGRAGVTYELPQAATVRVEVFDTAGRRVRTLTNEYRTAGAHRVSWDGRNSDGRLLAAGTYFVRVSAQGESVTERAVVLR